MQWFFFGRHLKFFHLKLESLDLSADGIGVGGSMWFMIFISLCVGNVRAGDVEEIEADVEANVFESEAAAKVAEREAQRLEQDRADYNMEKLKADQTISEAQQRNVLAKKKMADVDQETKKIKSEMAATFKARDMALKDLEKSQEELNIASHRLMKVRKEMARVKAQTEQARYEAEQNRQLSADNEKRRVRLEKEYKELAARQKNTKFAGTVKLKPSSKRNPASVKR